MIFLKQRCSYVLFFILSYLIQVNLLAQSFYTSGIGDIATINVDDGCARTVLIDFTSDQLSGNLFTDVVYHPNGKFYACTLKHLFEINPMTGNIVNLGGFPNDLKVTSLTCNREGVIYCAGTTLSEYYPNSNSWNYLGQLPVLANGDLVFDNGKLLLMGNDDNLYNLNMTDLFQSTVFMEFPEDMGIIGLTTLITEERELLTYAIGRQGGFNRTNIYELDLNNRIIIPVCENRYYSTSGAASTNEFHASAYPLLFDLDLDNSEGGNGVHYYLDTLCTNTVPIVDKDVAVHSAESIDSIVVQIGQAIQPDMEELWLDGSFNLDISGHQSSKMILSNNGNSTFEDFEMALIAMRLVVASDHLVEGERKINFWMYPSIGTVQTAQSTLVLGIEKILRAGEDTTLNLCNNAAIIVDLFNVLGGQPDSGGYWLGSFPHEVGFFDPRSDASANFAYVIENGDYCPADTAWMDINVHTAPPFPFDTFLVLHLICAGDTVLVETPPSNADLTYYWNENIVVEDDVAILSEEGIHQIFVQDLNTGCTEGSWVVLQYEDSLYLQENIQLCPGEVFSFEGQTYEQDTTLLYWINSEERCDTLVELQLEFLNIKEGSIDTLLCEGETIDIAGQSFSESGFYEIVTTTAEGCDSIINLQLEIAIPSELMIDISDFDCEDTSRVLSATGFETYQWSNGFNTPSIVVDQSGIYGLTVTDEHACVTSGTIEVQLDQVLTVEVQSIAVSCPEGTDGFLILSARGGRPPYEYLWSDGSEDSFRSGLMAGLYSVTTTDTNGCEQVWEGNLEQPPFFNLVVNIQNASDADSNDGSITIDTIIGGTPPYQLNWNTGQSAYQLNELIADTYTLNIIDSKGCAYMETFVVDFNTSIKTLGNENDIFNLYPNPIGIKSQAVISSSFQIKEIQLLNYAGQIIWKKSKQSRLYHLLAPEHSGLFFVKVVFDNGTTVVKKWIVTH